MSIRALTFDLDDTLWYVGPVIARAEKRLHAWLAEHYPRIAEAYEPESLRALCGEVVERYPSLEHDKTALRIRALRLAAERSGYHPSLAEIAFEVFYEARQEVAFFPDVLPVLGTLKGLYPLGALSNGNADVRLVGLAHIFDFHISAIDVGAAKPDSAMFRLACERLGVEPQEVAHVGDDPDTDVWGAAQAGMKTVWVNRENKSWTDARVTPDAVVPDLFALMPLLSDWPA